MHNTYKVYIGPYIRINSAFVSSAHLNVQSFLSDNNYKTIHQLTYCDNFDTIFIYPISPRRNGLGTIFDSDNCFTEIYNINIEAEIAEFMLHFQTNILDKITIPFEVTWGAFHIVK